MQLPSDMLQKLITMAKETTLGKTALLQLVSGLSLFLFFSPSLPLSLSLCLSPPLSFSDKIYFLVKTGVHKLASVRGAINITMCPSNFTYMGVVFSPGLPCKHSAVKHVQATQLWPLLILGQKRLSISQAYCPLVILIKTHIHACRGVHQSTCACVYKCMH